MDGAIRFDGIIGGFILLATPVVMTVITLINLVVYLVGRKSGQSELKWSKYFLLSAIIFLLFDGIILVFIYSQNTISFNRDQAMAFDRWMLLGWIPAHLFGYFLVAVLLRFLRVRKEPINKFIDKFR
ncbi:MAG TPA: hypothetical protein VNB22_22490 [Pyrinomonadaceae bacterium]|nr:hypothetical protein [Pyrinomonadaceae bacterium]